MGTRADYYIGDPVHSQDFTWLGSSHWDGYPQGRPSDVIRSMSEEEFRNNVSEILEYLVEDGWPWPWEGSFLTDYAYAWFDGKVWASHFGRPWFPVLEFVERSEKDPDCEQEDSMKFRDQYFSGDEKMIWPDLKSKFPPPDNCIPSAERHKVQVGENGPVLLLM